MRYEQVRAELANAPRKWLITGAAGFIGSNLLQSLLELDQQVVGFDNFATGHRGNLQEVERRVAPVQWRRFRFIEGDIRDPDACRRACDGVDFVLHQAALGSVPRSIEDPITTNSVNIGGFLEMLTAARSAGVKRFVYAASSSTYGDHPGLPKVESLIGKPLSPYAVTKLVERAVCRCLCEHLRLSLDRPALFQYLRRPPRSRRSLCGRDPQVDRRDD